MQVFEDEITDDEEESIDDQHSEKVSGSKRTKQNTIKYESDEDEGGGADKAADSGIVIDSTNIENVQNGEALSSNRNASITSETDVGKNND